MISELVMRFGEAICLSLPFRLGLSTESLPEGWMEYEAEVETGISNDDITHTDPLR